MYRTNPCEIYNIVYNIYNIYVCEFVCLDFLHKMFALLKTESYTNLFVNADSTRYITVMVFAY